MKLTAYFTMPWWRYVTEKPFSLRAFFCRWRGHPYEVVWYSPYGYEPDMTCNNCGDDLG